MSDDQFTGSPSAPAEADALTPAVGSVVGLIAAQSPGRATAEATSTMAGILREWQNEPGGLTVVATVQADAATIDAVSGSNVWGSFCTTADALIVVAALARERAGNAGVLELTGVRMLAYEPRRRSARARLARPVLLFSGGDTHEAMTLDLSRGGCRVFTRDPGDPRNPGAPGNLSPGYELGITVDLEDGVVLETNALVVRADGPELALRFTDLAATEAAEVDAAVFRELVRVDG